MKNKNHLLHTAFSVIILAVTLLLFMNQPIEADAAPNIGFVFLNAYSKTVNIGDEFYLLAVTSNGRKPTFTSSNSKIASVNTYGKITAKKAGTAKITVKIKNGEAVCTIQLSDKNISLENGYTARLTSKTSNGHPVTYRSDKRSIATVDEKGYITAKKTRHCHNYRQGRSDNGNLPRKRAKTHNHTQ